MMHAPGPHWTGYHQSYIGHHPVHLAYPGYRPSYYNHSWYHGPWRGYGWGWGWGFGPGVSFGYGGGGWGLSAGTGWGGYGPYGPYGYAGYPLGWGYGGWGLGGVVYSSGYYPYYNPYYAPVSTQIVVYDYSRPIPVVTTAPAGASPTDSGLPPPVNPTFDAARQAFREGDYATALSGVDLAIEANPADAVFHEFRALVLFARHDYRKAAVTLHSLLSIGPGWDWTTMSSLYADPFVYSEQLQALEKYTQTHPQAAYAHFVLGYHYMIGGHKAESVVQLQQVAELLPNDRLARELVLMVKGPPRQAVANDNSVQPMPDPTPAEPVPAAPPIDKTLLPGEWQAARPDGSKFSLSLTEDGKFRWKFTIPNQPGDQFGGTYSVDGSILILERPERGTLAGTMTFADEGHFNFKLVGSPPDDKGLDFGK
ncbi:MAG: hypothetical protein JWM11_4648 [Planctomycetaceae bacterium]|nr:hypothetical protein [Planctomycetaceae bacterium]